MAPDVLGSFVKGSKRRTFSGNLVCLHKIIGFLIFSGLSGPALNCGGGSAGGGNTQRANTFSTAPMILWPRGVVVRAKWV